MFRQVLAICLTLSLVAIFSGQALFSQESKVLSGLEILDLNEKWETIGLDYTKIAHVENLTLTRDAASFQFKKGEIYLLNPILGRVTGAVFIGEGSFKFTPPTEIEKYQLQKFQKSASLDVPIKEICFRFSDTTEKELGALNFAGGNLSGETRGILSSALDRSMINTGILEDIVQQEKEGLFFAEIKPESGPRLLYLYEPDDLEEVALYQESKFYLSPFMPKFGELVCSFHKQEEYAGGFLQPLRIKTGSRSITIKWMCPYPLPEIWTPPVRWTCPS